MKTDYSFPLELIALGLMVALIAIGIGSCAYLVEKGDQKVEAKP